MDFFEVSSEEPVKCKTLSTNSSFLLQRGWERIPETLLLNLVLSSILLFLFACLNRYAWSRKSRLLTRVQKGWIQFIYGDRESTAQQRRYALGCTGHRNDLQNFKILLPRKLTTQQRKRDGDEEISDIDLDQSPKSVRDREGTSQLEDGQPSGSREPTDMEIFKSDERTKRRGEYQQAKSRFERTNSTTSIGRYSYWFLEALFIKDSQILEQKGSDALQYLIFQRYIIAFLILLTFICLVVVLPVNIQGTAVQDTADGDKRTFFKTTINNLDESSSWFWVHAILSALIIPVGIYLMHRFSREIKADEDEIARRTLFIQRIYHSKRTNKDIVKFFADNFPNVEVEGIQFVYDITTLSNLSKEHKNIVNAKFYCNDYQVQYGKHMLIRPYFLGQFGGICCCCSCCPKEDGFDWYKKRESELEFDIRSEMMKTISKPSDSAFITFKTEKMALDVYKNLKEKQKACFCWCKCLSRGTGWIKRKLLKEEPDEMDSQQWIVDYAPYADDMNWEDLTMDTRMRWLRKFFIYLILLIIFCFLSTPTIIIKWLEVTYLNQALIAGLGTINSTLTEFLNPFLLLLFTIILPAIVTLLSTYIPYKTISALNHAIMWKVFFFLLLMVIILPSVGFFSLTAFLGGLFDRNATQPFRWECLFPVDNGAFFINYTIQAAFLGNTMELMRFPELVLYFFYVIMARSPAEYEDARQNVDFDFAFGVRYPRFLLIFAMVVIFSLATPLIVPCGLVYMIFKHLVDRYNIYFVYQPSKINGRIHSTAVLYIHISLVLMQMQILTFLLMRTGISSVAAFSVIVLLISILVFVGHCFFHWFRNINYLTYNATTRQKKAVHKDCVCLYLPQVVFDVINHRVVTIDDFSYSKFDSSPDVTFQSAHRPGTSTTTTNSEGSDELQQRRP